MIKPERDTEQCVTFFKQEADLLSKMNHKNIVKVKHLIQLNRVLYMGMDCIQGGRLSNLICDKKTFTDLEASKIMKSILKAVSYIHEMGIIHRDMKTANILLNDPNDLSSVKIIDFGFGDQKGTALESYDDHVGTLIYMAPEVASKKDYTKSVDIWAVGIIMHLLLAGGKHPFYIKESDTVESFKKKLLSLKKV
jgi:calcium/calmodulin-dependent protein kinase I